VALVRRLATDESVESRTRLRFAAAMLTDGPEADREPARAMLRRFATDRSAHEDERAEAIRDLIMDDVPAGLEIAAAIAAEASEPVDLRWRTAPPRCGPRPSRYATLARGVLAAMVHRPPTGQGFFDESVGEFAAEALAEFGGAADRSLLVRACADDAVRPNVRCAAAAALYQLRHGGGPVGRPRAPDRGRRRPARRFLARDNAAVACRPTRSGRPPVAVAAHRHRRPGRPVRGAQALAKSGPGRPGAGPPRAAPSGHRPTVDGAGRVIRPNGSRHGTQRPELAALAELAREFTGR
jgi:hypothetical protein